MSQILKTEIQEKVRLGFPKEILLYLDPIFIFWYHQKKNCDNFTSKASIIHMKKYKFFRLNSQRQYYQILNRYFGLQLSNFKYKQIFNNIQNINKKT
ncbi:unnamed protein product [Paramecium pentaurelia]|uniref:Uncharacterized protein n=1 Tax=Paramecium pentaurelia TaxID=43138 RepID=A0A8S1SVN1_9CILI|nr:unnamed protein product [Paramecium pentaurelia]